MTIPKPTDSAAPGTSDDEAFLNAFCAVPEAVDGFWMNNDPSENQLQSEYLVGVLEKDCGHA